MPKPSAPSAPLVQVWESPQTTSVPGWVMPSSGPMTCTMPCSSPPTSNRRTPALRVSSRSESTSSWAQSCAPPVRPGADEITWSAVAKVSSGIAHAQAALGDLGQRLAAAEIVQQVPVDVQQRGAAAEVGDHVRVPELFEHA